MKAIDFTKKFPSSLEDKWMIEHYDEKLLKLLEERIEYRYKLLLDPEEIKFPVINGPLQKKVLLMDFDITLNLPTYKPNSTVIMELIMINPSGHKTIFLFPEKLFYLIPYYFGLSPRYERLEQTEEDDEIAKTLKLYQKHNFRTHHKYKERKSECGTLIIF